MVFGIVFVFFFFDIFVVVLVGFLSKDLVYKFKRIKDKKGNGRYRSKGIVVILRKGV